MGSAARTAHAPRPRVPPRRPRWSIRRFPRRFSSRSAITTVGTSTGAAVKIHHVALHFEHGLAAFAGPAIAHALEAEAVRSNRRAEQRVKTRRARQHRHHRRRRKHQRADHRGDDESKYEPADSDDGRNAPRSGRLLAGKRLRRQCRVEAEVGIHAGIAHAGIGHAVAHAAPSAVPKLASAIEASLMPASGRGATGAAGRLPESRAKMPPLFSGGAAGGVSAIASALRRASWAARSSSMPGCVKLGCSGGGASGADGATGAMPANPLSPALTAAAGLRRRRLRRLSGWRPAVAAESSARVSPAAAP